MQKNITSSFSFFLIIIVICLSFKIKADENFSFSNAYKKALSNSNMIKKNEFLLNSKSNLISNAYSNKDWNLDFTSSLTLDNKKSDNIGDYVDQKTTVNTISLDKTLIDFGFTDKSVEIALNNKKILLSITTNGRRNTFSHNGRHGSLDIILWPIINAFSFSGFKIIKPFIAFDILRISDTDRQSRINEFKGFLDKIHSAKLVNIHSLNDYKPDGSLKDDINSITAGQQKPDNFIK